MQFENVTCPHCGLLCDDLTVQVDDLSLQLLSPKYSHCEAAFADASLVKSALSTPQIDGKPVSLEEALNKAAKILRASSQPLINGLIADVQTCRDAITLTEKVRGVIDHANGTRMRSGTAVMQRIGEVKATLAEVRNRADCVVIFGSGVLRRFPRLFERILRPTKTLGNKNTRNKNIFLLELANNVSAEAVQEDNVTTLSLNYPLLESLVYRFQELITRPQESIKNIDQDTQILIDLQKTILESNYTTFVWSAAEFNLNSSEHTVQALTETIKNIMKKVRCVGLPLGGSKGEVTANQVSTWQTGVPLPVAFMSGTPVHNPVLFDGMSMLHNKEVDSLVWIATYNSEDLPPNTGIPTIVLGHPKMKCGNVSVYIPTGVPGIDYRGLATRTDGVATLPLQSLRASPFPASNELLNKLITLV